MHFGAAGVFDSALDGGVALRKFSQAGGHDARDGRGMLAAIAEGGLAIFRAFRGDFFQVAQEAAGDDLAAAQGDVALQDQRQAYHAGDADGKHEPAAFEQELEEGDVGGMGADFADLS